MIGPGWSDVEGDLLNRLLDSVWRGGGVRLVQVTEREQALLAGLVVESGDELEAIVNKVGGWHAFGPFLRDVFISVRGGVDERAGRPPAADGE